MAEPDPLAPVYYLCGVPFARDRAFAAIRQRVLGSAEASAFNYDSFDGKGAGADQILAAARTVPMLGGQRLVVVRSAHELPAEQLGRLVPYLDDPSPYAVVVMLADKADLRSKFFVKLRKTGVLERFEPLKDRDVPRWLAAEAQRRDIQLKPGVPQRIGEAVGLEMGQLADALERLALYVGLGNAIRVADVEDLLAQTRQRSIFELTHAVGQGQRREAMLVLRQMRLGREPALRIAAMLARHVRQLWSVRELASTGTSNKDIAGRLGIHPYFVSDMIRQAQRFDLVTLRRTHRELWELDRELKSSRVDDDALLDRTVLRLCSPE